MIRKRRGEEKKETVSDSEESDQTMGTVRIGKLRI